MKLEAAIFDLDGTLLDTLEDICGAANHTLRELGYPERTLAEMRRFVGNGAEMQMRRALGADADEETVGLRVAVAVLVTLAEALAPGGTILVVGHDLA